MGPLFQSRAPAALLGDKNVLRRYWECPGTDPLSPFRCFDCPPPPPSSPYSTLLQPATVYSPTSPNTTCLLVPGLPVKCPQWPPPPGCFTLHGPALQPAGKPLLGTWLGLGLPLNPPPIPLTRLPPLTQRGERGTGQSSRKLNNSPCIDETKRRQLIECDWGGT